MAVLIAIVCGSSTAISFGLIATGVVFFVLRDEHPELGSEMRTLFLSCLAFALTAAVSGAALYAELKRVRWRRYTHLATAAAIALLAWLYWPAQ